MSSKAKKIVVVGAGGLGTAICSSLALSAETPLELSIYDPDQIELSNLNRQVLFTQNSIGKSKAQILAKSLKSIHSNSRIIWDPQTKAINPDTIEEALINCSTVVDATDSPKTKFYLNSVCVTKSIPLVHAAAAGLRGQALVIYPKKETACLRCIFEEDPESEENCQQAGILGAFVGSIGMLQASLVRQVLNGEYSKLLHSFTMSPWRVKSIGVAANPDCPICSQLL